MKRSIKHKPITIQEAVKGIKTLIEDAIRRGGNLSKTALIRSQKPINLLHDAVKSELMRKKVSSEFIFPSLGSHKGELKLSGRLKCKDQDVCVVPNDIKAQSEIITYDGLLNGDTDSFGKNFTGRILAINVRSQLSSIEKNFDTLYERTFAETVNLHLRCPEMVLGELYMIPVKPYDDELAKEKRVGFQDTMNLEKYIKAFSALNNRNSINSDVHKYERVCLLIVDFSRQQPKIYHTTNDLKQAGLIDPNAQISIDDMNFPTFVGSLLDIYATRFGKGKFS